MTNQVTVVEKPLLIMFLDGADVVCHIHPTPDYGHEAYGLLICDIVWHVANAFKVDEDDVWEWVDKERDHHTIEIRQSS